jgi:alpha-methylacyl-CoA racemase|tara:strand:+ start:494 stop:1627 length:1134 start_codon:yes stop_codon:yes gene_type:complete
MGPLKGIKVIEFSALGPGPFCGMILADLGAEVIVIDRFESAGQVTKTDIASRGKKSIAIDLKKKESIDLIKDIVQNADVVIEGLRPGKMEKLGMGPEDFFEVNPKLIYGRMTGWGQHGPLSSAPGHDINYIALTGALSSIGSKNSAPLPPLNLVGDFGGGGMVLAMGICAALVEVSKSGKGQIIDSAMTDGSALLMSMMYGFYSAGIWTDHRESNLLDGAAHFYGCYECKDKKFVSIGSIEPQFYQELIKRLDLDYNVFKDQMDRSKWPEFKKIIEKKFKEKTRDEWCDVMEGGDVCFAPVLSLEESINYKHNKERETFVDIDGVIQPAPAPRFSNTPGEIKHSPVKKGENTREILKNIGKENLIEELLNSNIISEG